MATYTEAPALTPAQLELMRWLHRDVGQYGECKGKDLDVLFAEGLAEWSSFSRADQPTGGDFRWVDLTDKGRALLLAHPPQ